jgi:hypothetical protein
MERLISLSIAMIHFIGGIDAEIDSISGSKPG